MELVNKLKALKKKTITKSGLEKILNTTDPESVYNAIQENSDILIPVVSSKTNGNRRYPIYLKYRIAFEQKDNDEAVTAIRAGTVMFCGNYRGYGQVVFVQSKTGQIYAYCGLGSIIVKKGQYVIFGDTLGSAGTDSISGASQITLMVFQKSKPIDPAVAPRG